MTNGIWATPAEYISFADSDRRELLDELYTANTAQGFAPLGWLGLMPDPDPVLKKTGDGVSVLRDLTADDKVISSIQNRKLGTLKKKDFLYEPGRDEGQKETVESKTLCANLEKDLANVDLYNVFSEALDAPYYGAAFVEVLWRPEGGWMHIDALKPRPVEWFAWNERHEPLFKSAAAPEGEPIPFGKAVVVRHFPNAVNPYGLRLLSRCLWPVAIKKGGIQFWATLCERFGMPWVIGTARQGAQKTERQEILDQLTRMVQNAVAVVTGGTDVKLHGIEGKGGDLHPALITYMNNAIATVLMGQTLTAEIGAKGSYAASKTHAEVLDDHREADETLVVKFMRDLGWIYREINSRAAHHPKFRYREPADYAAQAELDEKLTKSGVRFTKTHYMKRYHIAEDEFEVSDESEKTKTGLAAPGSGVDLEAGDDDFTPEQQAIEDLLAGIMPEAAGALEGNEQKIIDAVTASESYEEAIERLLELYPSLSAEGLQEALERVILTIDMFGRWTAKEEENDEG